MLLTWAANSGRREGADQRLRLRFDRVADARCRHRRVVAKFHPAILLGAMKAVAAISTQSNSSPAQIQFLFSDANADMWTAGFSVPMTNLDDVRLRTA